MDKRVNKNLFVVKNDSKWGVKDSERVYGSFRTQVEALEFARNKARRTGQEVVIKAVNGRIRKKYSYGNDSFPPRG